MHQTPSWPLPSDLPIRTGTLITWSALADYYADHIPLGEINWPMIVRSLIAEIDRLEKKFG